MISSQPHMPHASEEGVRDTWAKGCVEGRLVKRRAELQMQPLVWTILSAVRSGRSGKVRFGKLRAGCRHYERHWGPIQPLHIHRPWLCAARSQGAGVPPSTIVIQR